LVGWLAGRLLFSDIHVERVRLDPWRPFSVSGPLEEVVVLVGVVEPVGVNEPAGDLLEVAVQLEHVDHPGRVP